MNFTPHPIMKKLQQQKLKILIDQAARAGL